ncbi:MAG: dethiobiotin synthase [Burkholderiales bacterium]
MLSYFITGTDTGVGKTLVSCALLHRMRGLGYTVVGMKPVAAGCEELDEGWINEDVRTLRSASSVGVESQLANPYLFKAAVAPHIAAREEGIRIELLVIERAFKQLGNMADAVVVEGVGGFRVPLNEEQDTADLAVLLNLPVILVVGMRLGCLNHTLLTQEAIEARGLHLAGWVANTIDPQMPRFAENLAALQERVACPLLGVIPHMPMPDPGRVALRLSGEDSGVMQSFVHGSQLSDSNRQSAEPA